MDYSDNESAAQHLQRIIQEKIARQNYAYNSSLTKPVSSFEVIEARSKHFADKDWKRTKAATRIQRFVRSRSRRTKKRASAAAEAKPASGQGGRKRRYRRGRSSRRSRR
jgi:hypothetical protein